MYSYPNMIYIPSNNCNTPCLPRPSLRFMTLIDTSLHFHVTLPISLHFPPVWFYPF